MRSAVLRMTHLIDNFLNASRLIDGGAGLYLQLADMDMTALLQEVCQLHREMVPGSHIIERFDAAPVPMVGDAKLLFQVFSNVLANAVKYSPGGGAIVVEAETTADEVVVAIADHGIGIPQSDLGRAVRALPSRRQRLGHRRYRCRPHLVKMAVDLIAAASRSRARKARGRASPSACRAGQAEPMDEWVPTDTTAALTDA